MDGTDISRSASNGAAALVIVVDDDPLIRSSLDSLFRSVGFATRLHANAREALESDLSGQIACVVTDVRMPEVGGFEFQAALGARGGHIPIIFMTGHGDIPMSVRAMKAGAVDFLSKPFRDQDMLDAVNAAIEKGRARREATQDAADVRTRYDTLTPREREVMAGVVRGLLNKQVAGELGIAEITVKLHRASVMRKMGAKRLPDLVRMADGLAAAPGG
ncbi:response regulator transcription factor [uncultured Sphingomonas sp.]|uniref:response regulator transcription factor n=1 Tax=uncultured Sphingomonas sp. TaxID=158754 RepID=UPI0025E2C80F|nr:response regulator transcription factor [uncultured Sphingomonas sp.]